MAPPPSLPVPASPSLLVQALARHDRARLRRPGAAGITGLDEVGRGCLAGPVCAGAVHLPAPFLRKRPERWLPAVDDSKKLSRAAREKLGAAVWALGEEGHLSCALGWASPSEIDGLDITGATFLAMDRALAVLAPTAPPGDPCLVDGRPSRRWSRAHEGVVGGDGRSLAIALASAIAKVARDAFMAEQHDTFPDYGWDANKGYATAVHRAALATRGPTPLHRRSFLSI